MLRVGDLMTQSVVTLTPQMSLAEAAATLATLGVSGAPVCDDGGRMLGVFSKSDAIRQDGTVPPETTVGALMTAAVVSVRAEDPLSTAIALIAEKGVHRLMVTGEDGQLAGILTPIDIVKAIAGGRLAMAGMEPLPGIEIGELAGRLLAACDAKGITLVTAESLTGGLIAATLSSIPGASRVLAGGFITYSKEMKSACIGVDPGAIEAHGVVSEEVARSMARGALACGAGPGLAIAVTGVAGPGPDAGGTPAGTVHIACAVRGGPILHRACALGDIGREAVRARTVQHALELALQALDAPPA